MTTQSPQPKKRKTATPTPARLAALERARAARQRSAALDENEGTEPMQIRAPIEVLAKVRAMTAKERGELIALGLSIYKA